MKPLELKIHTEKTRARSCSFESKDFRSKTETVIGLELNTFISKKTFHLKKQRRPLGKEFLTTCI